MTELIHRHALSLVLVCCGASGAALAQARSAPREFHHGGDAFLHVVFESSSPTTTERTGSDGERLTETVRHRWSVDGYLEVKTSVPAVGKRKILVVGTAGALEGSLHEEHDKKREKIYGEGGLHEQKETWRESFDSGVVLFAKPPGTFGIEVDTEARTWTAPELADAFDGVPSTLRRKENYEAVWEPPYDLIVTSYDATRPPGGLWGGHSPLRPSGYDAQYLGLRDALEGPQALSSMVSSAGSQAPTGTITCKRGPVTASITWSLVQDLPGLELRVTSRDLDTWLPQGARVPNVAGRLPGPRLQLTAEVVDPTGAEVTSVRIRKLRFRLEDTSRLPGICGNWPYGSDDTSPDLEFDSPRATDEGQALDFEDLTTLRKTVFVVPYDFGGFTTLRVTAELDDGSTLRGRLVGQDGDPTAIRIPARAVDSKVAQAWLRENGAVGKADDADDESKPAGDGDGDGLALFEEYRGFYARGKHVRCDPHHKEVFVHDRVYDRDTRAATMTFWIATETNVESLDPETGEIDESNVVNKNRGGPTRGEQHAVKLVSGVGSGQLLPTATARRPGRGEVLVTSPGVFEILLPGPRGQRSNFQRAIVQAMCMLCGVQRPGTSDLAFRTITVARDASGAIVARLGEDKPIRLLEEHTERDLAPVWLAEAEADAREVQRRLRGTHNAGTAGEGAAEALRTRTLYLGVRGGEHSGPMANVMRNTLADGLWLPESATVYVFAAGSYELGGIELVDTSVGDGTNTEGPHTRFGSSERPPSRSQFRVNDHAP